MYDAFISYSHAADARLAASLHGALHRLCKPWYRLRALHIFRDKTSLSASPALWAAIARALDESQHFVLLASPEAARSLWVEREIAWWLANKSVNTMVLALTDGDIVWDATTGDFDWNRTNVLPRSIKGTFTAEPLFVDLRWARNEQTHSVRQPQFRAAVLDIAAVLHKKPKDELDGEDIHQHRRALTVAWAAATICAALAVVALWQRSLAVQRQEEAQHQTTIAVQEARIALGHQLAAQAELARTERANFLPRSILLAAESLRLNPSIEAYQSLRFGVMLLPLQTTAQNYGAGTLGLSANGSHVVVGRQGELRVWALDRAKSIGIVRYSGYLRSVAVSDDGRYVAASVADDQSTSETLTRVWSLGSGAELGEPTRAGRQCPSTPSITFTTSNRYVAVSRDQDVVVSELSDGLRELVTFPHTRCITALAFQPNDSILAAASLDGLVRIWNLADKRMNTIRLTNGERYEVMDLSLSPDGRYLATGSTDRTARIWQRSDGFQVARVPHTEAVGRVVFSPDSGLLATASWDLTARVWDFIREREIARIVPDHFIVGLAFGRENRSLMTVTSEGDVGVYGWDLTAPLEPMQLAHNLNTAPFTLQYSRDGKYLAIRAANAVVQVWALQSGRRVFEGRGGVVSFTGDGTGFTLASDTGEIEMRESATGARRGTTLRHGQHVDVLVADGEGEYVFAGAEESGSLWKVRDSRVTSRMPAGLAAKFVDEDKAVVSVDASGLFRRLDVTTGRIDERRLNVESAAARFSADGRSLAITTAEGIRIFEVGSLHQAASVPLPPQTLDSGASSLGMAISADGRYLAVFVQQTRLKEGNTVSVWDVREQREVARFSHDDSLWDVAFSPDDRHAATVGFGSASIWLWRDSDLKDQACRRLSRNLTPDEWQLFLPQPYQKTCDGLP